MIDQGYAFFETPIGLCVIAWRSGALVGVQLPERGIRAAKARLEQRFAGIGEAPAPAWVDRSIARIAALLRGEDVDLSDLPLDLSTVGAFEASVYRAAQSIPRGATLTYAEMAERLGDRQAARAVGQALGRNPWPIVVPCHRIVAAAGRSGGFSAPGGAATKLKLLEIEGALAADNLPLFATQRGRFP